MALSIRFLNNFIITVTRTIIDPDNGQMVVEDKEFHIQHGDNYPITQYQRHPDGRLDVHFPDTCPLSGVAHNLETDVCEVHEPRAVVKSTSNKTGGCGTCGGKQKKKAST